MNQDGIGEGWGAQLRLDLPVPQAPSGALRVWVLAASDTPISGVHRHHFLNPHDGAPLFGSGDIVLVRQQAGAYAVLGSDRLNADARALVLDHLVEALRSPDLRARRTTDICEAVHIALTPGRGRGSWLRRRDGVRGRTAFEHSLLQVAGRWEDDGTAGALSAIRHSDHALGPPSHPIVQGIFRREQADMLRRLFMDTRDPDFGRAAVPAYTCAAAAFASLGLGHQTRTSQHGAAEVAQELDQPWLSGLDLSDSQKAPAPSLGYAVGQVFGFALALESAGLWCTRSTAPAPLVSFGSLSLSDRDVLSISAGAASTRRRIVAVVQPVENAVQIRVSLADPVQAALGHLPEQANLDDVALVAVDSESVVVAAPSRAIRPQGCVTFSAELPRGRHEVAVRFAMMHEDDLILRFELEGPLAGPRAYM